MRIPLPEAQVCILIFTAFTRSQGDRATAREIPIKRRDRAAIYHNLLDLEGDQDIDVRITVRVRHRLIEGNAIDEDGGISTMPSRRESPHREHIGNPTLTVAPEREPRHLFEKAIGLIEMNILHRFRADDIDAEGTVGLIQSLPLHHDVRQRGRGPAGGTRQGRQNHHPEFSSPSTLHLYPPFYMVTAPTLRENCTEVLI